jgi:hypothetical protein
LLLTKLEITDESGNLTRSVDSKVIPEEKTLNGAIPIFGIPPFNKGAYKATITVIDGAPALKGIAQRLEGRYLLCGLERLPATIATGVGILAGVIGSIGAITAVLLAGSSEGLLMVRKTLPLLRRRR